MTLYGRLPIGIAATTWFDSGSIRVIEKPCLDAELLEQAARRGEHQLLEEASRRG